LVEILEKPILIFNFYETKTFDNSFGPFAIVDGSAEEL
jgi:hypothetical protein